MTTSTKQTYPDGPTLASADRPIPRYLQARLIGAPVMMVVDVSLDQSMGADRAGREVSYACIWFAADVAQEAVISREQVADDLFRFVDHHVPTGHKGGAQ